MKIQLPTRLVGILLLILTVFPLQTRSQTPPPKKPFSLADVSMEELVSETQQPIVGESYVGLIWWIPVEFWQISLMKQKTPEAAAAEQMKTFRAYTTIVVTAGKIGTLGNITFYGKDELRKNTRLVDAGGQEYKALETVSTEAQIMAAVIKPILASSLGPMGESFEMLFFPATGEDGRIIADPRAQSNFSVVITDLVGPGRSEYSWALPLSSLSPAKFCPKGGEKLKANWKFCPWHGNTVQ